MDPATLELVCEFFGAAGAAYSAGQMAGDVIDRLDEWADENGLSNEDVADIIDHLFDEPFGSDVGDFGDGEGDQVCA